MSKTAIIYARVSTSRQAEKQLPVDSQLSQARQKAADLGVTVVREFVDRGLSGTVDSRPAFRDAFLFCELNNPDLFITWSSSRFARNKHDATVYKLQLQRLGVALVYVSMDIDTDSNEGWALDSVLEIFDEYYSRQVSSDTRRSMAKVAADGFWIGGCPPYGFRPMVVPGTRRKKLQVDESEADLVRLIFKLKHSDRMGCRQIANYLNEHGHTNRSRPWKKTVVGDLLRNPTVIGKTVFGRKDRRSGRRRPLSDCLVVDSHDGIIDRDVWDAVQEQLRSETNNSDNSTAKSHFLLTGLLRCHCGASCRTESGTGRSKTYWYYRCRAAAEQKAHPARAISAPKLDAFFLDVVLERMLTADAIAELIKELRHVAESWTKDQAERKRKVSAQILAVQGKLNRLYEALEDGAGAISLQDIAPRIRQHKSDLERLENKYRSIEGETPPVYDVSRLTPDTVRSYICGRLAEESPRKVRGFLKTFIEQARIVDGDLEIHYNSAALVGSSSAASSGGSGPVRGGEPISRITNRKVLRVSLPDHLKRAA